MIKSKGSGMPYNHLTSELLTAPPKDCYYFHTRYVKNFRELDRGIENGDCYDLIQPKSILSN